MRTKTRETNSRAAWKAYKRVKEAARWLREREVAGLRSYERPALLSPLPPVREQPVYEPGSGLEGVSMQKLVRLVQKRMQLQMSLQMGPQRVRLQRVTSSLWLKK